MNNTKMKLRWVIVWDYNDTTNIEEFEFRLPAEIRMMQLESFGMKPTLHDRMNN